MTLRSLPARSKSILKRTGLLPVVRWLRRWIMVFISPTFRRRERTCRQDFLRFKQQYRDVLRHRLNSADHEQKRALVVGIGFMDGIKIELGLIKGLELAGFAPVVLTGRDPWLMKYYELAGVHEVLFWDEFADPIDSAAAEAIVARLRSFEDLLTFEYAGARVGKFAAATALRHLRVGSLDLQSRQIRERLVQYIAAGMTYATAAERVVEKVRPHLAMFVDRGYTPQGELFDICLAAHIDAITWNAAHKSNSLLLKRYTLENRDEHPASLSSASWQLVRSMEWTSAHRERLRQELYSSYASGDWYSEVGTQFNKHVLEAAEIRQQLGLDSDKKTAVIFPHILWDGTFFWGEDLFRNYEEWLVETVRAACANDQVNWIIKVHPANVVKNVRDGFRGEPAEVIAIRKHIGQLPPHLFIIPADSDINTFSLFRLMDYCLTVRGTIGIEAASFGVPVLTAGTGRYDHRGFTIDSESRKEYLERLASIQDIPPLSLAQWELAERFAYAVFLLRPLPLKTITLEYKHDARASLETRINIVTQEDWLKAPDLRAFAEWTSHSCQEDSFMPDPIHGALSRH